MDAILLCMKKRGILFFRKIKFPTTNVVRFHAKNNFLGLLRSRCNEYDNVLIMAHGANHAILTTTTDLHRPYEFKGPYTTGGDLRKIDVPRYTQIANAIPPLFAEQVGLTLKQLIIAANAKSE